MIVIEKQPPKEIERYRITCTCGCIFTCDNTDWNNFITGHGQRDDVIICPVCAKNIYKSLAMCGVDATIERIRV